MMLLEIDNLRLSIRGDRILEDVRLTIGEGQIFGLLGPNGAGKSTTIAAALGLLPFDGGSVRMFGRPVTAADSDLRRSLGVLPEQNGFYDWMTAEDYLSFYAELYGQDQGGAEIADRLTAVGLKPRRGQIIGAFSRGMRQRLGLARALIGDPGLLILDEPTNGLDPRGRREIHDILLGLAARGVGVLLCTHLLDDVDRLCHRIGIIVGGRTVAEGDIGDLLRDTKNLARFRLRLADGAPDNGEPMAGVSFVAREGQWVIVDVDADKRVEETWRELLFGGWPIAEIRREGGGLEDLYLSLTQGSGA